MEKIILQNPRPIQKVFALWMPLMIIGLIAMGMVILYFYGQRDVPLLVEAGATLAFLLTLICLVVAYGLRPRAQWSVTESGFSRVKPTGEGEIIRWDQIYRMKITTDYTLVLRWHDDETPATQLRPLRCRERHDFLFIARAEGNALMSQWKENLKSPHQRI